MQAEEILTQRKQNLSRDSLLKKGLYHSFQLPDGKRLDGIMSLEYLQQRLRSFHLPEDLRGKRVLDIGPWDGFFTFELERRGAQVTAIDYVDLDSFRYLHRLFNSRSHYLNLDVYELDPALHGTFDIVLFLGVLYHLKHPLLALEKVCAVTSGVCIIDSFVVDGEACQKNEQHPIPFAEFYEHDEMGGQLDNWSGPSVSAVLAWARAAGFAQANILAAGKYSAVTAAHRIWQDLPESSEPGPNLRAVNSHLHRGRCFRSAKEEYLQLWCDAGSPPGLPAVDRVFPEIDGFGIAPLSSNLTGDGLIVNVRLPPGLAAGEHRCRVKIGNSDWSKSLPFFVDLPPSGQPLTIHCMQDGMAWIEDCVDYATGGWLTIWVEGLTDEADSGNTIVLINDIPHFPEFVEAPGNSLSRQVNVRLRPVVVSGCAAVTVSHRGKTAPAREVLVLGLPQAITGSSSL